MAADLGASDAEGAVHLRVLGLGSSGSEAKAGGVGKTFSTEHALPEMR